MPKFRFRYGRLLAAISAVTLAFLFSANATPLQPFLENAYPAMDPTAPREVPVPRPAETSGGPAAVSPGAFITRGNFTSIQVNVDADGNNILGDAANEPTIAVNSVNTSQIAVAWRQFDTISNNFRQAGMGHSSDFGATWDATVLDPGQFRSDPVLASDRDGNFYFSSLSTTTSVELFRSFDGGATWSEPVSAFGGDKQWIAVDRTMGTGSGHLYQIWNSQFSCCGDADFTRSIDGGLSFQAPRSMPTPKLKWGTIDVGPDGTVYMAGSNLGGTGHVFVLSADAKYPAVLPTFSMPRVIDLGGLSVTGAEPNPGGLAGQVCIATDHSVGPTHGNVYVLASVNPPGSDPLDVMFIRSTDGGTTWSAPVRVNDDLPLSTSWQWFATMAVSPSGRIDAIWNDTRNSPTASDSEVYHSSSIDGGVTWTANVPLTPPYDHSLGYPSQNKLGDYYHMVSDVSGVHLAFAATFNGEQDVYYLRIMADCNNNGIEDSIDIAEGDSPDCTGNGIPDECESDCNANEVADSCDILSGTSEDCTENRLPDECEEDCNANGRADTCEIADGSAGDLNENQIPDKCETVLFVREGAEGPQTGLSWASAYADLQSALEHANSPVRVVSSIWVAAGRYTPSNADRTKSFVLPSGVTLYGGFAGNETRRELRNWLRNPTILSGDLARNDQAGQSNRGDNSLHVVACEGCLDTVLDGFHLTGGNANGTGLHRDGGGLVMNGGALQLWHCVLADNASFNRGGGALVSDSQLAFNNCLLAGNAGFEGAALYSTRGSQVQIIQSTIAHNAASGLSAVSGDFSKNSLHVDSSILWGNTDPNESPEDAQLFGMSFLTIHFSSMQGWSGQYGGIANSGVDPVFVDPDGADNLPGNLDDNFRLDSLSPAIDSGSTADNGRGPSDLDAHNRVLCGRVDRGAYEFGIGDFDCDGAMDWQDVFFFSQCLDGPGVLSGPCAAFDFDADSTVDLIDFGLFQTNPGE